MRSFVRVLMVLVALTVTSDVLRAQAGERRREATVRAQRPADPARDSLEERVRVRMESMLRTQLGLSDAQMERLRGTNARFEQRRRVLFQREREARASLRDLMRTRDTTRHAEAGELLDRVVAVQRQRAELAEEEQKELATFLTPIQRARYFGMEEQIRRRVQEMHDRERGTRAPMRRPDAAAVRRPT